MAVVDRHERRPDVLAVDVDGTRVLYDPVARTSHVLNPAAAATWDLLDTPRSTSQLATALASHFATNEGVVSADLPSLIDALDAQHLLAGGQPEPPTEPAVPRPPLGPWTARAHRELAARPWEVRGGPFRAGRFVFDLVCDDGPLGRFLVDSMAGLATPEEATHLYAIRRSPASGRLHLSVDGAVIRRSPQASSVALYLLWHLNRMTVASLEACVVLHAAGVQRHGRTVVLPADPNAGKTTLTAGLVQRGFDYLTDESVAIDPATGIAEPYAKALSIDHGSQEVLADLAPIVGTEADPFVAGTWQVPPDRIRAGSVGSPAPIDLIVFPRFEADADTTTERLDPVEALLALLEHTFDFSSLGDLGLRFLAHTAEQVPAYRVRRGDLESGCAAVAALLDQLGDEPV